MGVANKNVNDAKKEVADAQKDLAEAISVCEAALYDTWAATLVDADIARNTALKMSRPSSMPRPHPLVVPSAPDARRPYQTVPSDQPEVRMPAPRISAVPLPESQPATAGGLSRHARQLSVRTSPCSGSPCPVCLLPTHSQQPSHSATPASRVPRSSLPLPPPPLPQSTC